jgi:guanylate kinase
MINDDFATALGQLAAIIQASRCRFLQQAARNPSLFVQLGIHTNLY